MTTQELILEVLLGEKRWYDDAWHVFDANGVEIADAGGILLRGVPGALLMWPKNEVIQWLTNQGTAKSFHKFTPIHDVEAVTEGFGAAMGCDTRAVARGEAHCGALGFGVAGYAAVLTVQGAASAQAGSTGALARGEAVAEAAGGADVVTRRSGVHSGSDSLDLAVWAGCAAAPAGAGATSESIHWGYAQGVQNLSDEELVFLVRQRLQRVRGKTLTSTRISL